MCKRFAKSLCVLLITFTVLRADRAPIVLDGQFDDWTDLPVLATDPAGVLARLGHRIGLGFCEEHTTEFRDAEAHAVSGNQARWEGRGIRLDTRWREKLPGAHARLVWALTSPLRRSLGYR